MRAKLYGHGGSRNHGCEAIIRTTTNMIAKYFKEEIELSSHNPHEDMEYISNQNLIIEKDCHVLKRYSLKNITVKISSVLFKSVNLRYKYSHWQLLNFKNGIAFSVGGDNYCGYGMEKSLAYINKALVKNNCITVLWSCSIEPGLLKNQEVVEDLKLYSLITPRESISYNALIEAGIVKNTYLFPDVAFTLDTVKLSLPKGFVENNTVGINISPLIMKREEKTGITMENYIALIENIINSTDMQIALIPHVVSTSNDDRKPLREIFDRFGASGRVVMIEDHNCMELKGYIARCRFFIGARTHATIAAYSSCVPTLVLGYSVKSKGIAKDIFGTHKNYVLPVQVLRDKNDLLNAFNWIQERETEIRTHLQTFMPAYKAKAWEAGEKIEKLTKQKK